MQVQWSVLYFFLLGLVARGLLLAYRALYPSAEELRPLIVWDANWSGDEAATGVAAVPHVESYRIAVPDATLSDLEQRIAQFSIGSKDDDRFCAGSETKSNCPYGISLKTLGYFVEKWRGYNWRVQEEYFNSFPQIMVNINGIRVHAFHIKNNKAAGPGQLRIPIILVHGWPGSFVEFFPAVVESLQKQSGDFSYDIIIPSIPGFGFSEPPHVPGFDPVDAAVIMIKLMRSLGYKKYLCQGGDYGSFICSTIAQLVPEELYGIHLNMITASNPPVSLGGPVHWIFCHLFPDLVLSKSDQEKLTPVKDFLLKIFDQTGYFHIQATKPDTIGIAMIDSPVFLLAYILEKFEQWSFEHDLTQIYSSDQLLNNVMIYWVTKSGITAARLYKELANSPASHLSIRASVDVPCSLVDFPGEIFRPPRSWLGAKFSNIITYDESPAGGHFAAMEAPDFLVQSIIRFTEKVCLPSSGKSSSSSEEIPKEKEL